VSTAVTWVVLPAVLLFTWPWGEDPAPSLFKSKEAARRLDCEAMTEQAARRERPGLLPSERPRGDFVDRRVLVCRERVLPDGVRRPLDEAILRTLDERASELASAAAALRPDLAERTWLVEAYYPSDQVSPKIRFATQNALMRQGLVVSDRTPVLTPGDLQVITRMPPERAYPAACQRYVSAGGLGPADALLAVVHRHPQETTLHAGICADGGWMWIR